MTQTGKDFDRIREHEDNAALDRIYDEMKQERDLDEEEQRNIWNLIENGDLSALIGGLPK